MFCAGMDAQVSYAFHSERKLHPEKFQNQLVNQVGIYIPSLLLKHISLVFSLMWILIIFRLLLTFFLSILQSTYLKLAGTQGWFLAPLLHPSSRWVFELMIDIIYSVKYVNYLTFMSINSGHFEINISI